MFIIEGISLSNVKRTLTTTTKTKIKPTMKTWNWLACLNPTTKNSYSSWIRVINTFADYAINTNCKLQCSRTHNGQCWFELITYSKWFSCVWIKFARRLWSNSWLLTILDKTIERNRTIYTSTKSINLLTFSHLKSANFAQNDIITESRYYGTTTN